MRRIVTILAAILAACSTTDRPGQEPERDLTTSPTTQSETPIASAVELNRASLDPITTPAVTEQPQDVPELDPRGDENITPSLNLVVSGELTPAPEPAQRTGIVGALAPGETVRIIPTNFPSRTGDEEVEVAAEPGDRFVVRIGGGSCQPRGVGGVLF